MTSTFGTGSASFVISPGGTKISYALHLADISVSGITAVQLHFGAPDVEGRAIFTLISGPFISPLVGTLTAADLEQIAATEGINTLPTPSRRCVTGIPISMFTRRRISEEKSGARLSKPLPHSPSFKLKFSP